MFTLIWPIRNRISEREPAIECYKWNWPMLMIMTVLCWCYVTHIHLGLPVVYNNCIKVVVGLAVCNTDGKEDLVTIRFWFQNLVISCRYYRDKCHFKITPCGGFVYLFRAKFTFLSLFLSSFAHIFIFSISFAVMNGFFFCAAFFHSLLGISGDQKKYTMVSIMVCLHFSYFANDILCKNTKCK